MVSSVRRSGLGAASAPQFERASRHEVREDSYPDCPKCQDKDRPTEQSHEHKGAADNSGCCRRRVPGPRALLSCRMVSEYETGQDAPREASAENSSEQEARKRFACHVEHRECADWDENQGAENHLAPQECA